MSMKGFALLLALLFLVSSCMASNVERRISVPPVLDQTIDIDVKEGDTLFYSFDVIDPSGACIDFSEKPVLGKSINQICAKSSSNSRTIKDNGRYQLLFKNKGTESVAVDLEYSVTRESPAAPGKAAAAEQEQTCVPTFILLALAGAMVFGRI